VGQQRYLPPRGPAFLGAPPAAYEPSAPVQLAVFQDGWWDLDPEGQVRGGTLLDNLVHRGDIPVTFGVFVNPGVIANAAQSKHRNAEYDAFDARYITFLLTEILPQVTLRWSVSDDPDRRLIAGGSSGGNCAFTAAWQRPDPSGTSSVPCPTLYRYPKATHAPTWSPPPQPSR